MQILKLFKRAFDENQTDLYLRPYEIIAFSENSGFLEFLNKTDSLDGLKKKYKKNLLEIYKEKFGENLDQSVRNFIRSLAGYSLASYLL